MNRGTGEVEDIRVDAQFFTRLRRDIHAHPELGFEEQLTSALIARTLTEWGIPVHKGLGKTGLVGVIGNGRSGRAIGLRADMDALPMTERNTFAHTSVYPGKMHACGHDGHVVMLLAAARHLASRRDLDGTVYLVFQPAEEGGGGAREMIKDGLFERFPMQAIFGAHNWPSLPAGQFAIRSGPVFASTNRFKVAIHGKGTHAAMPDGGIDPIPIACQVVQALQTIVTRNKRPMDSAVISVTNIRAGEALNVIPELCELQGTVRTFSEDVLALIERRMRSIALSTCDAFGATCDFEFERMYPATVNHAAPTDFVRRLLRRFVSDLNVHEFEPAMTAEDFSFYLLHTSGCYFLIGNGSESCSPEGGSDVRPLHNPLYDFNDELIVTGGSMWVRLVEDWFAAN